MYRCKIQIMYDAPKRILIEVPATTLSCTLEQPLSSHASVGMWSVHDRARMWKYTCMGTWTLAKWHDRSPVNCIALQVRLVLQVIFKTRVSCPNTCYMIWNQRIISVRIVCISVNIQVNKLFMSSCTIRCRRVSSAYWSISVDLFSVATKHAFSIILDRTK